MAGAQGYWTCQDQKKTSVMPNNEQNPEECDATDDDSSNTARYIIFNSQLSRL